MARARRDHSRVLVMFGFEGCSWCHKLHRLFEQDEEIRKVLRDEYVLVLVDIHAPHADESLKESKGALAVLVWTVTTFLGTVPINKATLTWRPDAPPTQWRAVVSRWERPGHAIDVCSSFNVSPA